jgi:hypothetical protein
MHAAQTHFLHLLRRLLPLMRNLLGDPAATLRAHSLRKFGAKTPFYPDNALANGMAAINLGKQGIGDSTRREHYRRCNSFTKTQALMCNRGNALK